MKNTYDVCAKIHKILLNCKIDFPGKDHKTWGRQTDVRSELYTRPSVIISH